MRFCATRELLCLITLFNMKLTDALKSLFIIANGVFTFSLKSLLPRGNQVQEKEYQIPFYYFSFSFIQPEKLIIERCSAMSAALCKKYKNQYPLLDLCNTKA